MSYFPFVTLFADKVIADIISQEDTILESGRSLCPAVMLCLVAQSCLTLCDPLDPTRLLCPWDSPGRNTGLGCQVFLQGIFPTQGSNPGLLHCRWILYQLNHQGSLRIQEWVAYPFSRGSSQSRD